MDISALPLDVQLVINQARVDVTLARRDLNQIRELNYKQAGRIMELEFLLSFVRRVGDGVYVDHQRLMSLYRFYNDKKEATGLQKSKYYGIRKTGEPR